MKIPKRQLRRIIRKVITESEYPEYGSGADFSGSVTLAVDYTDMPTFNYEEFQSYCDNMGGCQIVAEEFGGELIHIEGSFDALWEGWVNCCGDEPDEFMVRVVKGHENCPAL